MSGSGTEIVYWDACIFYALFKGEDKHGAGILAGICKEYELFLAGKIKLITSTITIAEVSAGSFDNPEDFQKFKNLQYHPKFEYCSPTVPVMEITSHLRDYYFQNPLGDAGQYKHLQLGDALHMATAIAHGADHFVTLDGKNKVKESAIGILKLTSPLAGRYSLNLRKPAPPPAPKQPDDPADFELRTYAQSK